MYPDVGAFVLIRPTQTFYERINLRDVTANGVVAGDNAGTDVATGDLNADGLDDLVVGAPLASPGARASAGVVYVQFGNLATGALDLATADITYNGIDTGDLAGAGVAVGDVNNDGDDDLVIGAPGGDVGGGTSGEGEAYVLFGPLGAGTFELSGGVVDITVNGIELADGMGWGTVVGDLDDDGDGDLAVAANFANPGSRDSAGQTYVLFGPLGVGTIEATTSDVIINGILAFDNAGQRLATGDLNGDDRDDLVMGAPTADPGGGANRGETYVLFGPLGAGTLELSQANVADVTYEGTVDNAQSGVGVAVGDIDNDGQADLVVGAALAGPAGQTHVVYGPLAAGTYGLTAAANVTYNGIASGDLAGRGVAVGRLNNDALDDIVVGAFGADPTGKSGAGETYVLFGPANV